MLWFLVRLADFVVYGCILLAVLFGGTFTIGESFKINWKRLINKRHR